MVIYCVIYVFTVCYSWYQKKRNQHLKRQSFVQDGLFLKTTLHLKKKTFSQKLIECFKKFSVVEIVVHTIKYVVS